MRLTQILYVLFLITLLLTAAYCVRSISTRQAKNDVAVYTLVTGWPQLPSGFVLGNPTGIGVDTSGNIFVFHRAGREWPLLGAMPKSKIDAPAVLLLHGQSGTILNSWGAGFFIMPHGLTVDRNNNVWVTDVALNQVFKFSHEGVLLLELGEPNVAGNDAAHFNRPTDVAVAADGCFYVSDGYRNSRIVKFSPGGKYLFEWGKKGSGQGQFNIPHGLAIDESGRVYVADRENSRIQVFDTSGRFLKEIKEKSFGAICSVAFDREAKNLVAVDDVTFLKIKHRGSDVIMFDSGGKVQSRFGRSGFYNGPLCWYHDVAVDGEGNIYVGDIYGNRLQKFRKVVTQ